MFCHITLLKCATSALILAARDSDLNASYLLSWVNASASLLRSTAGWQLFGSQPPETSPREREIWHHALLAFKSWNTQELKWLFLQSFPFINDQLSKYSRSPWSCSYPNSYLPTRTVLFAGFFFVVGIWVHVLPSCNMDEGICGSSWGSPPKWVSVCKKLSISTEEKPVPELNQTSIAIQLKDLM